MQVMDMLSLTQSNSCVSIGNPLLKNREALSLSVLVELNY